MCMIELVRITDGHLPCGYPHIDAHFENLAVATTPMRRFYVHSARSDAAMASLEVLNPLPDLPLGALRPVHSVKRNLRCDLHILDGPDRARRANS